MNGRRIAVLSTALAIGASVAGRSAAKQIELDVSLGTPVVIEGQPNRGSPFFQTGLYCMPDALDISHKSHT